MRIMGDWGISIVLVLAATSYGFADQPAGNSTEPAKVAEQTGADAGSNSDEYYELLKLFVDTLDQVERNYVQDISRRELLEAAIEGMLKKLDQHSDYIAPEDLEQFRSGVESEFGGVGIQVTLRPSGELTVISPIVGSPAYRAGMLPGDIITEIKGESTEGLGLEDSVKLMKGPVGTKVTVKVRHSDGKPEEFELNREIVRVETVLGQKRKGDDSWDFFFDSESKLGYIRLTAFSRYTTRDLRRAVRSLDEQGLNGLILDLRFNPGGLLSTAIQVCDLFVAEGRIVSTEGRNTKAQSWDARARGTFNGFPIAVLVNRYSASASEIVAACLQDHERAVVIGERTFGKGSVQNIISLENGRSALKLTTAGYQRPSGRNIHRFPDAKDEDDWGVQPNDGYKIEWSERQLRRMARQRSDRDVVGAAITEPSEENENGDDLDEAITKAIEYLKTHAKQDNKEAVAVGADAD